MGWNTIKIDRADSVFSEYIRRRDGKCVRCGRRGEGEKGVDGLQASHYWSRRHENTRFDPENVDALCAGCHRLWGGDDREQYANFKKRQLGEVGYKLLLLRCNQYCRRDRKLSLMQAKLLLKSLTTNL